MNDSPFTTPESSGSSTNREKLEAPSNFSILKNIIISPQKAFKDIQFSYPILLPFLSIILLNALLAFFVLSSMDFQWYMDTVVEQTAGDLSKAEQDNIRVGLEMVGSTGITVFGVLGSAIVIAIVFCILALYFLIVSNINGDGFQFGQWFSLVSWTSIPSIFGALVSLIFILSSTDGQISLESSNPLSLNALFFDMDALTGVGNVLSSIDLTTFWTIALMIIGYAKWTESSYVKSSIVIFIPYTIFYTISFLIA